MDDPSTTDRDRDCAALARAALFPLKINRSKLTLFPAVEALDKIRDDLIARHPNLGTDWLFPRRVLLVRSVAGNSTQHNGQWQWNGQPDLDDASLQVIPGKLSVKCLDCANRFESYLTGKRAAFIRDAPSSSNKNRPSYSSSSTMNSGGVEKEIILCTDRLLKSDYKPEQMMIGFADMPPKTLAAVEETLAHEITLVRDQLQKSDDNYRPSCLEQAASEIRAAAAAECYFNQSRNKELYKGSRLRPSVGYPLLPRAVQSWSQNRCIRSVATEAANVSFACSPGNNEGKKGLGKQCVEEAYQKLMNRN